MKIAEAQIQSVKTHKDFCLSFSLKIKPIDLPPGFTPKILSLWHSDTPVSLEMHENPGGYMEPEDNEPTIYQKIQYIVKKIAEKNDEDPELSYAEYKKSLGVDHLREKFTADEAYAEYDKLLETLKNE